jgi:HEAT repeats/PBS lyase HEAT-like repeat
MTSLGQYIPAAIRNHVLLRVIRDVSDPVSAVQALVGSYDPALPDGADITREVLTRWFNADAASRLVETPVLSAALTGLGRTPELHLPGVLEAAVKSHAYSRFALSAMRKLRDPAYLPLLAECLDAPWLPDSMTSGERAQLRDDVVPTLAAYGSTEAARILLDAATRFSGKARDDCLEAAEKIRKYQDAVAEWDRRAASGDSRVDAVTKLVALLKDPDAATRAAAAGGLATLKAVEQIPALIALLKDPEASVRDAVQAALTRLEASTP